MNDFNQRLSGNEMLRFAGIASMFRFPVPTSVEGVDVGMVGVLVDIGRAIASVHGGTNWGARPVVSKGLG